MESGTPNPCGCVDVCHTFSLQFYEDLIKIVIFLCDLDTVKVFTGMNFSGTISYMAMHLKSLKVLTYF